ncbi:MAG TPA: radical SAM protein [bacterium]|nr:radical SAM protein [bacterium]
MIRRRLPSHRRPGNKVPHVLLVNPWITDFAAFDLWIKPLGLLRLGGMLKQAGVRVTLLDCLDRHDPEWLRRQGLKKAKSRHDGTGPFHKTVIPKPAVLKGVPRRYGRYGWPLSFVEERLKVLRPPDAILVTSGMTYWYPGVVEMIDLLKRIFPDTPVILGGVYATLCPDHARRVSGAHAVVQGDGERALPALLRNSAGIRMREDPNPVFTVSRPLYSLYSNLKTAAVQTSRGCPNRCPFCASHLLVPRFEPFDHREAAGMIRSVVEQGAHHVAFYDDALLENRESRLFPILRHLSEYSVRCAFHTPNGLPPRLIDGETAAMLFRSGFMTLRLSFETVNPERQQAMGKKVTSEDLKNAVKHLRAAGFSGKSVAAYVLTGLPGQGPAEVMESIRFVYSQKIRVSLAAFSPVPGTDTWREAVDRGLLEDDSDPLLTNNTVFAASGPDRLPEWFVRAGTLVSLGNSLLLSGKEPLKDALFSRELKDLSLNPS